MAAIDLIGPDDATWAALGVPTGQEDRTPLFVTAISARIDDLCGPVVQRTVTEYHDGGACAIWPHQTPVASVTTLKEWDGSTLTTLTKDSFGAAGNPNGFWFAQSSSFPHGTVIERRSSGSPTRFLSGHGNIELVYLAGRAASTEDVSEKFKMAAATIIRRLWKREAPVWAQSSDLLANLEPEGAFTPGFYKAVDPMVSEFLGSELRLPGIA